MNLTKSVVVEVLSEPYPETVRIPGSEPRRIWKVDVKEDCYGRIKETTRIFDSREEAEKVTEGYTYLS